MEDQINCFQFSRDRVDEETEDGLCWDELSDGRLVSMKKNLKIRIKMPKAKHEEEEITDKHANSGDHVCKHCNKCFSSGKALGGHMRVHNSEREENADSKNPDVEEFSFPTRPLNHPNKADTTCKVCMRTFPSEKSLFGHMRCHPERTWRGINPPQSAKNSSSSTVDSVGLKIDDQIDSATTRDQPTLERAPPLGSWPVTAKRGRKFAIPVPPQKAAKLDDQVQDPLPEAVMNLLLLAQGDSKDSKNKRDSEELEESVKEFKAKKAKRLELDFDSSDGSELENMNIDPRSENLNTAEHSNDSEESESMTMNKQLNYIIDMNKRKRKQKFRALDTVSTGRYTCSTCNKQFDCHQALGGHRASHRKYKSTSTAQGDEEGAADADENNPITNGTQREGWIDSNESHRCKICNKCFPSGQALGGHKRCHFVAHPEPAVTSASSPDDGKRCHLVAPSEPAATSATSPDDVEMPCFRGLDFDLNEMPPVEEEDSGILFPASI